MPGAGSQGSWTREPVPALRAPAPGSRPVAESWTCKLPLAETAKPQPWLGRLHGCQVPLAFWLQCGPDGKLGSRSHSLWACVGTCVLLGG